MEAMIASHPVSKQSTPDAEVRTEIAPPREQTSLSQMTETVTCALGAGLIATTIAPHHFVMLFSIIAAAVGACTEIILRKICKKQS
jgi:hypothetical protein